MSASHVSITGYTDIPITDRVEAPTSRRHADGWVRRTTRSVRRRLMLRRELARRRRIDIATAPPVRNPRDTFILRHADDEIRGR